MLFICIFLVIDCDDFRIQFITHLLSLRRACVNVHSSRYLCTASVQVVKALCRSIHFTGDQIITITGKMNFCISNKEDK